MFRKFSAVSAAVTLAIAAAQSPEAYGQDAGANAFRAIEHLATRGGGAPGPRIAGQMGGRSAAEAHATKVANEGRGHDLERVVKQALQTNPQALGPYQAQFAQAAQDPDPMRLAGLISELNRDPQFRATVGQQLLQATNPGGRQ